jgi:signal transduction histidine kinase
VLDIYQPIALFKGLSIEMIVARNLPKRIFTDPVRLSQVLKNLLFNAVKYTTEGRVTVIVEYEYNHRSIPYDDVYLEPV